MKRTNNKQELSTTRKVTRSAGVMLVAFAMLFAMAGPADAVTATVNRGFYGNNATHYRKNTVTGMTMTSSHIHFSVISSCNLSDPSLGNINLNESNVPTSTAEVPTSQSGWGKANAGFHSATGSNGHYYTSPGGQGGWDVCW